MELMVNLFTLDNEGVILAVVFGILILGFGQNSGPLFLFDLFSFLALSAIVTRIGKRKKKGIGVYEKSRGWKNVVANGAVPVLLSALYFANLTLGFLPRNLVVAAYIASVAAVTADKFASEVGVLNGEPTMLITMKKVKKGMSGAVTLLGLGASFLASWLIGLSVLLAGGSVWWVMIVAVSGFLGCFVDSLAGYFEEQGIGNKYTSNILCSLAGAIVCLLFLLF